MSEKLAHGVNWYGAIESAAHLNMEDEHTLRVKVRKNGELNVSLNILVDDTNIISWQGSSLKIMKDDNLWNTRDSSHFGLGAGQSRISLIELNEQP